MKLTRSADFALRIVMHLAQNKAPSTMPTLSEELNISYNHLSKIVQKLSKAQILSTRQGKFGGVSLIENDTQLNLKDIIDIVDGPTILTECQSNPAFCGLSKGCRLKVVMGEIQHKIDRLFEDVKISDLIEQKEVSR